MSEPRYSRLQNTKYSRAIDSYAPRRPDGACEWGAHFGGDDDASRGAGMDDCRAVHLFPVCQESQQVGDERRGPGSVHELRRLSC
jgi:hypothetical protein